MRIEGKWNVITLLLCGWLNQANAQVYVDQNALGANDGTSWTNAYTELYDALEDSNLGISEYEIWVAAGTYKPDPISGRNASFYVYKNNINIYGGFAGSETLLQDRNLELNKTILSGDIGVLDDISDNAYHTLLIENVDYFLIDGVTISDGNADGAALSGSGGGVLAILQAEYNSIYIQNSLITENFANSGGGIAFVNNASGNAASPQSLLYLENVVVADNLALSTAGGVLIQNAFTGTSSNALSNLDIVHSTFYNNEAPAGATIYSANIDHLISNDLITVNLYNSIFQMDNTSAFETLGVGTFNAESCLFSGNPLQVSAQNSITNTDPLLNSDYTLNLFSPAINKANNLYGSITTDIVGEKRIRDGNADLGAFEYVQYAQLIINEFVTNNPGGCDLVELRALTSGSTEGISLRERQTTILNLPDIELQRNDLIVVHLNNSGCNTGSGNETASKDEFPNSTYSSNFDGAYDWYVADGGLVGTDVVLSLMNSQSFITDAVFGTNSDGSTAIANNTAASEVATFGEWEMIGGGIPPGGFVGIDFEVNAIADLDNTGSMQRLNDTDTNTKLDWLGNVTETFGSLNSGQDPNYNNPPVILSDVFNVYENISQLSVIGQVQAFDPDKDDVISFQITSGDPSGLFSISSAGVILLAAGQNLDAETSSSYNLTAEISDGNTTSGGSVIINVIDVNEAPSFLTGVDPSLLEDVGAQSLPGWATSISDGDNGTQGLAFEFDIPDPTFFLTPPSLDANTGDLFFEIAPGQNGSVLIGTRLSDDAGTSNGGVDTSEYQYFSITVQPVNDAPSFIVSSSLEVLEDAGPTALPFASLISDGDDETQQLIFEIIASDPGSFSTQPYIDPANGELQFETALNANGDVQLSITVKDDGGISNGGVDSSEPQDVTLTIHAVNDEPWFDHGGDISVIANSSTQSYTSFVSNIDDGDPEVDQTLQFQVSNDNPGLFLIQPYIYQMSDLIFTPQYGAIGSATVTLILKDNGGTAYGGDDANEQTFVISVGANNLPPSFTKGPDIVIDEDAGLQTYSGWATNIDDGNGGTQNVTFIVSSNNTSIFEEQPAVSPEGTLTFKGKTNTSGYAQVKIVIKDDGGTANGGINGGPEQYFTIDINSVNDSPAFDFINFLQLNEDFSQLIYSPAPKPIPADESNQVVVYSISPDPLTISFVNLTFDETTGRTTIDAVPDSTGAVTFTITADDGQPENGTYEQQLYIEILPDNDVPRVVNLAKELTIDQNANSAYEIPDDAFMDPEDGNDLTITVDLEGQPLPNWIIYDEITKTILFNPDGMITGDFQLGIKASDKELQSVTSVLTVSVLLVTGIKSPAWPDQGAIFPNPATNSINLPMHIEASGYLNIRIVNTSGETLMHWQEKHNQGDFILTKDISNLKTGIYLVKIVGSNFSREEKFIKR